MAGAIAVTAPIAPDFHVCDQFWGVFGADQCLPALNAMPIGAEPVDWEIVGSSGIIHMPNHMPMTWTAPGIPQACYIALEAVGLGGAEAGLVSMAPNVFGRMASWVITQCAARNGVGGFITTNISNTIQYLLNPSTVLTQPDPQPPASSLFYTITVKGLDRNSQGRKAPGKKDPSVAGVLYGAVITALGIHGGTSLLNLLHGLGANWERRTSGGNVAWYGDLSKTTPINVDNQMAYVCDASLGKPAQVDCSKLQYSEFGPPSDTITIGPDAPKVLSSGTCNVAISADSSIALVWAAIIAAVDTLIEICVDNPLGSAQGGRAVAGIQSLLDLRPASGKRKTRRLGKRDTTGLNALPHGVKVTVSGPQ